MNAYKVQWIKTQILFVKGSSIQRKEKKAEWTVYMERRAVMDSYSTEKEEFSLCDCLTK